jgi:hypothetical protein
LSWQDELRQLDEDLAAGKVSAQDYRSRRDAVLAQTAAGAPAPQAPTPQAPTPQAPTPQAPTPQAPTPQAPPQPSQWTPAPQPQFPAYPQQNPSERTQSISQPPPGQAPGNAPGDPTQVVRGGQAPPNSSGEATQIVRPVEQPGSSPESNAERTQIVTGFGGRPSGPGGQNSGWSAQPPTGNPDGPPWGGAEFPPLGSLRQNEPWYSQGPEVFDRQGGGRGKTFAIGGVVLLVVLVVVAILVFKPFSGTTSAQQGGGGQQTATRPAPTTTPTPTGPIAHIPGSTSPNSVRTFADVTSLGFLSPEEITSFQSGQPTATYFSDVRAGSNRVLILVVKTSSAQAAGTIVTQLAELQVRFQMKARVGGPVGVLSQAIDTAQGGPLRRAEWASGTYAVRVQVQGPDPTGADQELTTVLNDQLAKLPANG